jgi:hypothetical protein
VLADFPIHPASAWLSNTSIPITQYVSASPVLPADILFSGVYNPSHISKQVFRAVILPSEAQKALSYRFYIFKTNGMTCVISTYNIAYWIEKSIKEGKGPIRTVEAS